MESLTRIEVPQNRICINQIQHQTSKIYPNTDISGNDITRYVSCCGTGLDWSENESGQFTNQLLSEFFQFLNSHRNEDYKKYNWYGFCHYSRLFLVDRKIQTLDSISQFLQSNDIISKPLSPMGAPPIHRISGRGYNCVDTVGFLEQSCKGLKNQKQKQLYSWQWHTATETMWNQCIIQKKQIWHEELYPLLWHTYQQLIKNNSRPGWRRLLGYFFELQIGQWIVMKKHEGVHSIGYLPVVVRK